MSVGGAAETTPTTERPLQEGEGADAPPLDSRRGSPAMAGALALQTGEGRNAGRD